MSALVDPNRRFAFALTAAVAATTVAVGVTAATLLGWVRPSEVPKPAAVAAPAEPSVVYVPIAPTATPDQPAARVAMDEPRAHEAREREHEHEREGDDD